jgi:hypothetical protein
MVTRDTASAMALTLDTELGRLSAELGCAMPERLVAIVQTRQAYLQASGAAEWSAGQYDGRIRVALIDDNTVGPKTRRVFAHELTHACLANIGSFPPWLHEGLAQRMSGDRLSPDARAAVAKAIAAKRMPKLERLNLAGTGSLQAHEIYALALWATEMLFERHAEMGIRNILRNNGLLGSVTAELNRGLGL